MTVELILSICVIGFAAASVTFLHCLERILAGHDDEIQELRQRVNRLERSTRLDD